MCTVHIGRNEANKYPTEREIIRNKDVTVVLAHAPSHRFSAVGFGSVASLYKWDGSPPNLVY